MNITECMNIGNLTRAVLNIALILYLSYSTVVRIKMCVSKLIDEINTSSQTRDVQNDYCSRPEQMCFMNHDMQIKDVKHM